MSYTEDKIFQEIYGKPAYLKDVPNIDERRSIPSTGLVGNVYMDAPLPDGYYGGYTAYPTNTRAAFYTRDNQGYPVFEDRTGGVLWGNPWTTEAGYGKPLANYEANQAAREEEYQRRLEQERAMQAYLNYDGAY